ncbi:jerky protein homolog [Belonocnema kinseyi]|uniref:jerky protein homolog n=1 Tax=Belonocnema kinseyi TaxID=2817044 RepID=UPI00143D894A|nr:jerky protein homolog [Belonocnema kinseyi]
MEKNTRKSEKIRKLPKYKQLNLTNKLAVIKLSESGKKTSSIASQFNVSESTIVRIVKDKEKYLLQSPKMKLFKDRTRIDSGKNADLEKVLFELIKMKRSLGVNISGPVLQEKALSINEQLGGSPEFRASKGWLGRFKKRFGIRQLSVQGERLSADTEAAEDCTSTIKNLIEEEGYPLDNVYNADETGLCFKTLPKNTLVLLADQKQAPGHKESKERLTVMNCANVTGSHKIPLLLIGKSQRPRCFKNVTHLPVVYREQPSAWMDSERFA